MSSASSSVDDAGRTDSARSLALRTTAGTLAAVVLALACRWIAVTANPSLAGADPFAPGPIAVTTVVAGAGAAVVYAALVRLTARPTRNFLIVAGAVFVLSLLPVFLTELGLGLAGQLWLAGLHLAVAVPVAAAIART